MKKIVICPDSFKGSLSARQAALAIRRGLLRAVPDANCVLIPLADGGEGTVEAFGATKRFCNALDANLKETQSFWGEMGRLAIIELAAVCGLPQTKCKDPMITSTYGVGQLILDALDHGKREFILALGGSATNDFACGMAAALGAKFYDADGNEFLPTGGTLSSISSVDLSLMDKRIKDSSFVTMCDVTNPLCGHSGASFVFAKQKGAKEEDLPLLDQGLYHVSQVMKDALGIDVLHLPGGGAAGGCGAGSVLFLSSTLQSGIDTVLASVDFEQKIQNADLILTGEGKFDSQSLKGKAVFGVSQYAFKHKIPCVVLCGAHGEGSEEILGVTAVFSIQKEPVSLNESFQNADQNLENLSFQVLSLAKAIKGM